MDIKVFYTDKMVGPVQIGSPSAHKPAEVVASWRARGFPIVVIEPAPVTEADLCLAHDPDFVRGVLSGELANGFLNFDVAVAESTLYTNGAMLAAACEAFVNRRVAVAPCSGFHHALYRQSSGYCTFNGLMVTALKLKQEGLLARIGILDFDQHRGDGTEELINRHQAQSWIEHFTAGILYGRPEQAGAFLKRIPEIVEAMGDCDLILYQAGADPHIDDPLGGWLTTDQLRRRDRLVFESAAMYGLPIAWNLAGGYQIDDDDSLRPILDIHDNTMRECLAVYG